MFQHSDACLTEGSDSESLLTRDSEKKKKKKKKKKNERIASFSS